jgi:hypothetical protein
LFVKEQVLTKKEENQKGLKSPGGVIRLLLVVFLFWINERCRDKTPAIYCLLV